MCVNQLIGKQNHWELSDVSRMQMPTPCRKEKGRLEEGEEGPRCTVIQKTARLVKTYVGQETVEFMGNVGESKKKPVKCWARRNPGKPESTQGKFIVGNLLGRGTIIFTCDSGQPTKWQISFRQTTSIEADTSEITRQANRQPLAWRSDTPMV